MTFYETVAIPALSLGETDRARGVMDDERRQRVAEGAMTLVDNLEEYAEEEAAEEDDEDGEEAEDEGEGDAAELPDGAGKTVLCVGGRGELDEASAAMLAQVLTAHGATARLVETRAIGAGNIGRFDFKDVHSVVIGYLNADSVAHARYMVRRIKRARKTLRVGVAFWLPAEDHFSDAKLMASINCDFVARTMTQAVAGALSDEAAVAIKPTPRRIPKRRKPAARPRRRRLVPKPLWEFDFSVDDVVQPGALGGQRHAHFQLFPARPSRATSSILRWEVTPTSFRNLRIDM